MSYCRWSSDQFQSDIYCYESDRGYEIHIAARRAVSDQPRPARQCEGVSFDDPRWVELSLADWKAISAWLDAARREEIQLPHAGETFIEDTPGECADHLRHLRELGYYVPQHAIDALDEEAAEEIQSK